MDAYSDISALEAMGARIMWVEHKVDGHKIHVGKHVFMDRARLVIACGSR